MVNCIFCSDKKKRAFYGFPGENPLTCKEHASDDFVNLNKKRCQHPGCEGRALFGTDKAMWCSKHKGETGNLNIGLCSVDGCGRTKTHGYKKKTVCSLHAIPGMDDLSKNKCSNERCHYSGNFQFEGQRYCKRHLPEGGERVQKSCFCGKTASYGYDKREYCKEHSLPGMELIRKKPKL